MHLIDAHVDIYSGARGINFGLRLHLHPCSVCVSSKGSLEPLLLTDLISSEILSTGLPIERYAGLSTPFVVYLQQYQGGGGGGVNIGSAMGLGLGLYSAHINNLLFLNHRGLFHDFERKNIIP